MKQSEKAELIRTYMMLRYGNEHCVRNPYFKDAERWLRWSGYWVVLIS